MSEWVKLSLSLEQIRAFKEYVTCNARYASRMSLGFAYDLADRDRRFREAHEILRQLDNLEGILPIAHSSTKEAKKFKHAPLHPFWHKHFYSSRHFWRNIGERWGLERGRNGDLDSMIEDAIAARGHQPELCINRMLYDLVIGGLERRSAAKKLTGDWIIFAKHGGQNYYLGLAPHPATGQNVGAQLSDKLRQEVPGSSHFCLSDACVLGNDRKKC
jgi:hypothetical protein